MHVPGRTRPSTRTSTRTASTRTTSRPARCARPTAPQACWALEQHTDELAARDRHGPGRVPPLQLHRHRRRGPDAADVPADRPPGVPRERRRDERLRAGAARGRGDRPRRRLVADVRGALGRLREAQRRRLGRDRHRRAGVRHRLGHGAADARRRRARHAARGLHARLPGHRRRPVGHGRDRLADDVNNGRAVVAGREAGRRAAAPARGRRDRGLARATSSSSTGFAQVKGSPDSACPIADLAAPRTAASCCSAPARARRRRRRRPTTPTASASSAWTPGRRRRSAATRCASSSTATPASSACSRSRARTTPARSSTRPAPRARSRAAS